MLCSWTDGFHSCLHSLRFSHPSYSKACVTVSPSEFVSVGCAFKKERKKKEKVASVLEVQDVWSGLKTSLEPFESVADESNNVLETRELVF